MFRPSLVAGCLIALTLTPAMAQQPTQAQRDAVRASCRSDFMANCASVQPGGKEALECLLRNDSKLSSPCRCAVNAIATPAANPAETAPAAATAAAPSDTSPPSQGQSSTPVAAAPPTTKTSHPTAVPTRKTPGTTRAASTPATPTASAATGGSASASPAPVVPPLGRYARCCREEPSWFSRNAVLISKDYVPGCPPAAAKSLPASPPTLSNCRRSATTHWRE
jgi:hypothetical protein